jgi:uncharacterized protein (TIGR00730 family)
MSKINALCVYCGSSPGTDPAYLEAAQSFGKILAENDIRLIYGGGSVGLMGALAQAVVKHGGKATGVIPEFLLRRERPHHDHVEQVVVPDMHARKRIMFERADAFVALPGGVGTLEEVVEQLTWVQLGHHEKPVLLANINGFWGPLLLLIRHMQQLKFIHSEHRFRFLVADAIGEVLPKLYSHLRLSATQPSQAQRDLVERF